MKDRKRQLLVTAALISGVCFAGTWTAWGVESGSLPATTPNAQTVATQDTANVPLTDVEVKAEKAKKTRDFS